MTWLDKIGGRKFALSLLLVTLSVLVIFLAADKVAAAEIGVLFGFWASVAGIHAGANVVAKKYRPEGGG